MLKYASRLAKGITKKYEFSLDGVTDSFGNTAEQNLENFNTGEDKLHITYGMGFRTAINNNFIIAIDYGIAADKQDGTSGMYIGLNYIF